MTKSLLAIQGSASKGVLSTHRGRFRRNFAPIHSPDVFLYNRDRTESTRSDKRSEETSAMIPVTTDTDVHLRSPQIEIEIWD